MHVPVDHGRRIATGQASIGDAEDSGMDDIHAAVANVLIHFRKEFGRWPMFAGKSTVLVLSPENTTGTMEAVLVEGPD